MMAAPLKPWERASGVPSTTSTTVSSVSSPQSVASDTPPTSVASASTSPPSLPDRPSSLAGPSTSLASRYPQSVSSYGAPYSAYGSPYGGGVGYGASPYSTMGGMGAYSSPYSRFGAGYSQFGSYGGPYGGNPMYPGQPGFDPNGQPSLTSRMEASTSQTFALLSSLVQTFGSFSQMLESTYMATHSSFFAMLGVADQFAYLRGYLGEVLGVFSLLTWLRRWVGGERAESTLSRDFGRFIEGSHSDGRPTPRPSRKPIIVFLLAAFGLPLLMHKLVNILARRAPVQPVNLPQNAAMLGAQPQNEVLDPSTLTFARALYAFETTDPVELPLRQGEIVAVLSKLDPATGAESEWWRGRTREGRNGWFPRKWVEVVRKGEDPSIVKSGA